jgi:hypothetical protein
MTWQGSNFKGPRVTVSRLRARKAGRLKRLENKHKQQVRDRDKTCRFPLCGCRARGLFLEVSHKIHKGMGGDPTGERSVPELMVYLCNWRHKEGTFAIDRETLRWLALTSKGAAGPIAWEMRIGSAWIALAREVSIGVWEPFSRDQKRILDGLAEMTS